VAEDVVPARAAPARSDRAARKHSSGHAVRFAVAYMLLVVIAGAGIGALIVVLERPDVVRAPPWSTFVPTGSSVAEARQIATKVSGEYRLKGGGKVATVIPGPLQATRFLQTDSGPVAVEEPISAVAVQATGVATGKHEAGDFTTFDAGSTIAYQMCGFGDSQQNCGIVSGASAKARSALLRREALELSLYTLKYVHGVDAVLTYLPPPPSGASPTSVLIARKDVTGDLARPLTRTLAPKKVVLGRTHISGIKLPGLYTYDYQTLPGDGTAVLVLTPALGK
jgi:hypothetical protein